LPNVGVIRKVAEIGECWTDYKIVYELAKRLGVSKHFWESEEEVMDFILKPAGITYGDLKKLGTISGSRQYRKYEKTGFNTPSKKVEIYSSQLKEWNLEPLPVYKESQETPISEPELAREYPLVFTNWKSGAYVHAAGREIATCRGNHPEPLVCINSQTAAEKGIKDGDMVFIENKHGKIKQKAILNPEIDKRVVMVDFGWYFPEKADELCGWADANLNVLTNCRMPPAKEMGSSTLRGLACKIYKAE